MVGTNFADKADHSTRPKVYRGVNGSVQVQATPVVDLTAGLDASSEITASQASTFGSEGSKSSKSSAPTREPVQSCQCERPLRVNGLFAYWMVDRAGDRPVYTVDYFTSVVTS